ncbi:MAG TPA: ABC transporter [Desulfitobacteriaceae bacterium]|nr:ABC transporter [Desulfitobacteriaceae bacterium]
MLINDYYATGRLIKLNLRQHRVFLVVWILLPALLVLTTALTTSAMFPTKESLLEIGTTLNDPMVIGMHGKVLAISIAGYTAWRTKVMCSLLSAIFSFIMVVRHTRREEEDGRRELLGSVCVGRQAGLAAVLVSAFGINLVMAALILVGMLATGLGFTGSLAHALAISACGCFFAAAAGMFTQIFTNARSATYLSIALLAFLMVVHIGWNLSGNMGGLMYLSPLEWPLLIRSFAGERFGVLLIAATIIALFVLLSFKLSSIRDVGAGFIPERTGRAAARPQFKTPLALSWRLQKGLFISWLSFFGLIGLALGSVSQTMADITSTAPGFTEFVERLGGTDRAFMSLMIYVICMLISIYSILATQRMRLEEISLRAETLLALPVSRLNFAMSHLFISFVGIAVIITGMGLAVGIGAALSAGDSGEFARLFAEAVVKIPAVWVIAGITALLFGLVPRAMAGISYAVLGVSILIEFFWEQQAVSDAVFSLSPFAHVYPTKEITLQPVIGLLLAAILFAIFGLLTFSKRDISSN